MPPVRAASPEAGKSDRSLGGQCTPSGIRCHYRPFIEDVDDRLPDLIQEEIHVRHIPWIRDFFLTLDYTSQRDPCE